MTRGARKCEVIVDGEFEVVTQCVGICMIDPESGVCIGCGRRPEEITGTQSSSGESRTAAAPPLPPNVAAEVGAGTE